MGKKKQIKQDAKSKFHFEDKIFKSREFIKELNKVQDKYYNRLCSDLRIHHTIEDALFDYIFNEENDISFEEYLENIGLKYKTK